MSFQTYQKQAKWTRVVIALLTILSLVCLVAHHHDSHWPENDCPVCAYSSTSATPATAVVITIIFAITALLSLRSVALPFFTVYPHPYQHRAPPIAA